MDDEDGSDHRKRDALCAEVRGSTLTNLINSLREIIGARGTRKTRRLLVIDDDVELAQIVVRVVAQLDEHWGVDLASTVAEARRRLAEEHYEFVLVDYFLDRGELGTDLLDLIRKTQQSAGLAMMSSLDLPDFIELTAREGDLQILPKPFSQQQLAAFMLDVLGNESRAHSASATVAC